MTDQTDNYSQTTTPDHCVEVVYIKDSYRGNTLDSVTDNELKITKCDYFVLFRTEHLNPVYVLFACVLAE